MSLKKLYYMSTRDPKDHLPSYFLCSKDDMSKKRRNRSEGSSPTAFKAVNFLSKIIVLVYNIYM
ncbi:hypothetical protein BGAFAR04_Ab0022 (plasmid) [Borreliella garinii Far04]|nr:hypothetical protein BGAFAR04_Ab0022 [Borreliella garinii Far04]